MAFQNFAQNLHKPERVYEREKGKRGPKISSHSMTNTRSIYPLDKTVPLVLSNVSDFVLYEKR